MRKRDITTFLFSFLTLIETQFIIIRGLAQLNFYPVMGMVLLIRLNTSPIVSCIASMSC